MIPLCTRPRPLSQSRKGKAMSVLVGESVEGRDVLGSGCARLTKIILSFFLFFFLSLFYLSIYLVNLDIFSDLCDAT